MSEDLKPSVMRAVGAGVLVAGACFVVWKLTQKDSVVDRARPPANPSDLSGPKAGKATQAEAGKATQAESNRAADIGPKIGEAKQVESDPYVAPQPVKYNPKAIENENEAISVKSDPYVPPKPVAVNPKLIPNENEAISVESDPYVPPAKKVDGAFQPDKDATYVDSLPFNAKATPKAGAATASPSSKTPAKGKDGKDVKQPAGKPAKPVASSDRPEGDAVQVESDPYTPPPPVKYNPKAIENENEAISVASDPYTPPPKKPVTFDHHHEEKVEMH